MYLGSRTEGLRGELGVAKGDDNRGVEGARGGVIAAGIDDGGKVRVVWEFVDDNEWVDLDDLLRFMVGDMVSKRRYRVGNLKGTNLCQNYHGYERVYDTQTGQSLRWGEGSL